MNPILALGLPAIVVATVLLLPSPSHAPTMSRHPPPIIPPLQTAPPEIAQRLLGACPETATALSVKWGRVFHVDKGWLRSQAYAESRNVPTAVNRHTGALGILQIMPATADWLVSSLRRSSFTKNPLVRSTLRSRWGGRASDLFDPDVNVMLAAYYMYLLKRKFGDRHDLVAAAYDAGPNKIAYYVDSGEPLPERSQLYIAMVADAKRRGFM
jgi:soluble lytic murein transglycosylase-like protein